MLPTTLGRMTSGCDAQLSTTLRPHCVVSGKELAHSFILMWIDKNLGIHAFLLKILMFPYGQSHNSKTLTYAVKVHITKDGNTIKLLILNAENTSYQWIIVKSMDGKLNGQFGSIH